MTRKTSLRLIRRLGLALAIAAFAAPAAQAMPVVNDEGGTAAPQVAVIHAVSSGPTDSLGRPLSATEPVDSLGRPLTPPVPTDSLGRPLSPPELVQPTSEVPSDSSRFAWAHVGIGLFAFALLLAGGALIISRQNRRSRLAAA